GGLGGGVAGGPLAVAASGTSHAAARVHGRGALLALDAVHQIAAWIWIGGLAHLIVGMARRRADGWPVALLRRFSTLALVSVAVLVVAGPGLTVIYVHRPPPLLAT